MAFSEEYYVRVQSAQKGPYSFLQLKRLRDKGFINDETPYWRDGMEQWQPLVDLCGPSAKARRKMGRQRWTIVGVLAAMLVAAACVLAPPLFDAWREINQHEFNAEAAYWKARGFAREEMHKQKATVNFDGFVPVLVKLEPPANATVNLPATVFADQSQHRATWQTALQFDAAQREWRLISQHTLDVPP